MKNNLSVFQKSPYRKRCIIENIKYYCRCLKYAWQRATRGYSDLDLWNLNIFYLNLFTNSLIDFKENLHGAPNDLYDGGEENPIKKWEDFLIEMARHFYNANPDNKVFDNDYEIYVHNYYMEVERDESDYCGLINDKDEERKSILEKYFNKEKELQSNRQAELEKGLDMLKERFYDLWD